MHRKRASDFPQELLDLFRSLSQPNSSNSHNSQAPPRQHKTRVAEEPDCVVDEALSAPQRHVAGRPVGIEAGETSRPRRAKSSSMPFC